MDVCKLPTYSKAFQSSKTFRKMGYWNENQS